MKSLARSQAVRRRAAVAVASVAALLIASSWLEGVATGETITYITPTNAGNSNANWPAVNGTYTQNYGIAFTTGNSGPFDIDWIRLGLNTSTVTADSATLTIALRNTTNTTAYSAVAGTTAYATDTVTFSKPTATSTAFSLDLTSAQLTNISAYPLQANTAYALILYAPTVNIGMTRTTGFASGTTNDEYTVTNGFTMLTTFRNNSNYFNNSNSFPSLDISFGATVTAPVPEIDPSGLASAMSLVIGSVAMLEQRRRKRATAATVAVMA
jgi:hypothetical protein